jgi:hypothetical protein
MFNNKFIKCNTKIEALAKSSVKDKTIDTLFCLIEDKIFVRQGFQLIEVTLEHFAEGMEINLVEAQTILSGEAETVIDAKEIIKKSIEEYIEFSPIENLIDSAVNEVKNITEKIINPKIASLEELKQQKISITYKELIEKFNQIIEKIEFLETLKETVDILDKKIKDLETIKNTENLNSFLEENKAEKQEPTTIKDDENVITHSEK